MSIDIHTWLTPGFGPGFAPATVFAIITLLVEIRLLAFMRTGK